MLPEANLPTKKKKNAKKLFEAGTKICRIATLELKVQIDVRHISDYHVSIMTIKSYLSNETFTFLVNCNDYDSLVIGNWIGLHSVLLPLFMTFMYFVLFQLWHIVSLDAIQTKHASKSHDKTMFYQQYKNKN